MNIITATQYYNKVPVQSTTTSTASVETVIVNQDHLPKHITGGDSFNAAAADKIDAIYGGLQVDENVDLKAANYISSVLESILGRYFHLHFALDDSLTEDDEDAVSTTPFASLSATPLFHLHIKPLIFWKRQRSKSFAHGFQPQQQAKRRGGLAEDLRECSAHSIDPASSNKLKPSPSPVPSITTSTAASSVGTVIVNQDHLPKHIAATTGGVNSYNNAARMDALYGGPQVDESVDLKAACELYLLGSGEVTTSIFRLKIDYY
nr:uncharacterized protein LOC109169597 [Ipomoea batatas]